MMFQFSMVFTEHYDHLPHLYPTAVLLFLDFVTHTDSGEPEAVTRKEEICRIRDSFTASNLESSVVHPFRSDVQPLQASPVGALVYSRDLYICLLPLELDTSNPWLITTITQPGDIYQLSTELKLTGGYVSLRRVADDTDRIGAPDIIQILESGVSIGFYGPLTAEEFAHFTAIQPKGNRAKLLLEARYRNVFAEFRTIGLGDSVRIRAVDGTDYNGVLRYIGPFYRLKDAVELEQHDHDMWIGLELFGKSVGKGNTNGMFRGRRRFLTRENGSRFAHPQDFILVAVLRRNDTSTPIPRLEDALEPNGPLLNRLQQESLLDTVATPLTIEDVEDVLYTVLPYASEYSVELVKIHRRLIDDYGKHKHLLNVDRLKKRAGIAEVLAKGSHFIVVAAPGLHRIAREFIALTQFLFSTSTSFSSHFQNSLQTIRDISGCTIRLDGTGPGLRLTGTRNEVQTATLLLEEELGNLTPPTPSASRKSRKRKNRVDYPGNPSAALHPSNGLKVADCSMQHSSGDERTADCVICLSERPNIAFAPCGHKQACRNCASKIFESDNPNCPTCRAEIKQLLRIFE